MTRINPLELEILIIYCISTFLIIKPLSYQKQNLFLIINFYMLGRWIDKNEYANANHSISLMLLTFFEKIVKSLMLKSDILNKQFFGWKLS